MASNYRVELSTDAKFGLRKIQEYITSEFKSSQTANRQSERILKAIRTLEVFPKLYRVRIKDAKGRDIRLLPVDNYVVIYHVDEDNHIVKVLHISYGRRNFENMI